MARPPLWATPEEFEAAADAYFETLEAAKQANPEALGEYMPTVNGLCLHLGCCRETLWDYQSKPGFSHAVKKTRARLEKAWEGRLLYPGATGAIFWLKNQGWKDQTEHHHSGELTHKIERVIRQA